MRNTRSLFVGFLILVVCSGVVFAGEPNPDEQEQYPVVKLKVGEVFKICESGYVICPVRSPICDDPDILDLVDTPDGLGYKGKAKGSTLCSVQSNVGQRFIFRLIVE